MNQTFQLHSGFNPIDLSQFWHEVSEAELIEFCRRNPDCRIEMDKDGGIEIMPPTFSETGRKNFELSVEFGIWSKKDKRGVAFDSSTGFTLPNGARRSPDLSWVKREKWDALSGEEKRRFARLVPDFIVELRSESDSLKKVQEKMREYIENGVGLGWLIDPPERRVYIYRCGKEVEILENPKQVFGEAPVDDFILDLENIFD
ncbi:MAG TPA: Uma2 family endonuclease [Pyrinomonadaceae bacterium]|nr:Uma2 family endonuclease [Pyrinomonadaceae bacterium]